MRGAIENELARRANRRGSRVIPAGFERRSARSVVRDGLKEQQVAVSFRGRRGSGADTRLGEDFDTACPIRDGSPTPPWSTGCGPGPGCKGEAPEVNGRHLISAMRRRCEHCFTREEWPRRRGQAVGWTGERSNSCAFELILPTER